MIYNKTHSLLTGMDSGLVTVKEYNTIATVLNQLAKHGEPVPNVSHRLICSRETAELLGFSYSGFRAVAASLPIKRRTLKKAVRYYLPEIVQGMASDALILNDGDSQNYEED